LALNLVCLEAEVEICSILPEDELSGQSIAWER
jgi:hypothetical protein